MPICTCGCLKELSRQQIHNHTRRGKAHLRDKIFARFHTVHDHFACEVGSELDEISRQWVPPNRLEQDLAHHTHQATATHRLPSPDPLNADEIDQVLPEESCVPYQRESKITKGLPDWVDVQGLRVQEQLGIPVDAHLDDGIAECESFNDIFHNLDAWDDTDLPDGLSIEDIALEFEENEAKELRQEVDDSSE